MKTISFQSVAQDKNSRARRALITTPHGSFETPALLPVGTVGTVKGVLPSQLKELGINAILANTYHLHLRPGEERIQKLGGLHRFMGFEGSIVTDSGGFQVFSLASRRKIDEDGVTFASHIDGAQIRLTPEIAIEIQQKLGSDIAMPLDECPPYPCPPTELETAVERTIRWAKRCRARQIQFLNEGSKQALFGIVQGGVDERLRKRCAEELLALNFDGYSIGGVAVGEEKPLMQQAVDLCIDLLPKEKPRYLMGVGTPEDILMAVERGVDFFDCVAPTRNARNALVYTSEGKLKLRNAVHSDDSRPLDSQCDCPACKNFSRAYLRHLFLAEEMLGPMLATLHNLRFFSQFMKEVRESISSGSFASTAKKWREIYRFETE